MVKSGIRQDSSHDDDETPPTSCFGALSTLPSEPWDIAWFATVKGSEWLHLYLWMVKDLWWAQDWYFTVSELQLFYGQSIPLSIIVRSSLHRGLAL